MMINIYIYISIKIKLHFEYFRSLCDTVRSITSREPQEELSRLLLHHLSSEPNSSLSSVAQSTVDHILRMVQDQQTNNTDSLIKREDMTLLVRCFKSSHGATSQRRLSSPKYNLENPELRRREEKTLTQSSTARQPRPTRFVLFYCQNFVHPRVV